VASITYTLLRVTAPVPVSVRIYDLSGALVRQVYAGHDSVGEHARRWDGTDTTNHLVAPGIYLYRIRVDLQVETETASGAISVVY
jgi:flagellar hook assembly protein FlgD